LFLEHHRAHSRSTNVPRLPRGLIALFYTRPESLP
jgi:hypothetical protein